MEKEEKEGKCINLLAVYSVLKKNWSTEKREQVEEDANEIQEGRSQNVLATPRQVFMLRINSCRASVPGGGRQEAARRQQGEPGGRVYLFLTHLQRKNGASAEARL